ncbi:MAG: hypothetical protein CV090_03595 [Nitrospira sp. WS238]|nr:hypothetical protein [Nitrospira sp. WS238]
MQAERLASSPKPIDYQRTIAHDSADAGLVVKAIMAQVIRSGAFLQQCWSVHPLCVTVKRMTDEQVVVLSCSSCKSAHYLTTTTIASNGASVQEASAEDNVRDEPPGEEYLKACVSSHPSALSLREMDVFQDLVRLRCADCRRLYDLVVSTFETRQK